MRKSIALIVAIATLLCYSLATLTKPATSAATIKDAQFCQSGCTTKCDAKVGRCLITCERMETGNNCGKNSYQSPWGVLEVIHQRGSR